MRILGFSPTTSPPHNSFLSASDISSVVPSPAPRTRFFSEVPLQSRSANATSLTWKRSFTQTASPFFGFPGVVVSGSDWRNATYCLHRVAVQKLGIVTIWLGRLSTSERSASGMRGEKMGQFGGGFATDFGLTDESSL